ncbi:MAG: class I SAM-dependent methyltransferase [Planctomycetota bacterium]
MQPNAGLDDQALILRMLEIYEVPSLAAWRAAEFRALAVPCEAPILELGCGDGAFSDLLFASVDCAVDLSSRELRKLARRPGRRVACMDARYLGFGDQTFGTVFANCVLEHIEGLTLALSECRRVLKPRGTLLATVPLAEMNGHLRLSAGWYSRLRAGQLRHVNLFTAPQWRRILIDHGFRDVRIRPYLGSRSCFLWDRLDSFFCLGVSWLRVGNAYKAGLRLFPEAMRTAVRRAWTRRCTEILSGREAGAACAGVLCARLPGG